jgi:hypothetical protein
MRVPAAPFNSTLQAEARELILGMATDRRSESRKRTKFA